MRLLTAALRTFYLGLLLAGAHTTADSRPITFDFSSTIERVTFPMGDPFGGAVGIGSPVNGRFTFDSAAQDLDPDPAFGEYQMTGPPYGLLVTAGDLTFSTTNLVIETTNDYFCCTPEEAFAILDAFTVYSMSPAGPSGPELHVRIEVIDPYDPLSSDGLPLVPPDFSEDASRYFTISGVSNTGQSFAFASFDVQFQAVPEPSTAAMLTAGLLVAALRLLRREPGGNRP